MNPEDCIERNIQAFLAVADMSRRPTVSWMQRVCRIGYNQSVKTLEEMERRGILARGSPWEWRWALTL